jgi:hypothetical protein
MVAHILRMQAGESYKFLTWVFKYLVRCLQDRDSRGYHLKRWRLEKTQNYKLMQQSYHLDNNNLFQGGCRRISQGDWPNLRTINLSICFTIRL